MGTRRARSVRELEVYRLAFAAAMRIFGVSNSFPPSERYSLTDQVRRSARSVCTNLAEGWRKRRYPAVFLNKLSDAAQEAAETQTWLEFAQACEYIDRQMLDELDEEYIFAMLATMERKAGQFCGAMGMIHDRGPTSRVRANAASVRPTSYVQRPT